MHAILSPPEHYPHLVTQEHEAANGQESGSAAADHNLGVQGGL